LVLGGYPNQKENVILSLENDNWHLVDTLSDNYGRRYEAIWCERGNLQHSGSMFFAGHGIQYFDSTWKEIDEKIASADIFPYIPIWMTDIRGTKRNNVWSVGHFGHTLHFNGKTWRRYQDLLRLSGNRTYFAVSPTENSVFIVGEEEDKGLVIIGKIVEGQ